LLLLPYAKKSFFVWFAVYFILCGGCTYPAIQLSPPEVDFPQTSYYILRDYNTTWNALKRAILGLHTRKIRYINTKKGIILLDEETVPIQTNCDCGKIGDTPLTGSVKRKTTITLKKKGPQLTIVEIKCTYSTKYTWRDIYNRKVRTQTIPCVSSGRFESTLYCSLIKHLNP